MTALLELRENLKKIYSRNEAFILPVIKFLLSFIVLSIINGKMGYMTKLDNMAIVLIVSLLCSFLPTGFMAFFAMMFAVLHMYALSIETAAVGLVVFLLLYLLFLRFTAKEALVVVLTPVLCMLKLPYVMPVAMGLIGTPASCVSVGCGVVVYYLLQTVITNAPTINSMGAEEATAKLRLLIDGMLGNKAMLVTIAAFAITVIVVYLIRRMSVDHSWTIAMVAGVMIEVMILLVGDLMYDTNLSIVSALLGAVVTLIACKIIEFFRFCLDYSRTEKVQFEDDEYYYYVKAVPKMTVAAPTNTVKKINTQRRPAGQQTRTSGQGTRSAGQTYRSTAHTGRPSEGTGRSVVTERTPARNGVPYGQQGGYRGHEMSGGRVSP
ncbi:MAG: hypothetical protein ACLVGL_07170 [Waltera sp.]